MSKSDSATIDISNNTIGLVAVTTDSTTAHAHTHAHAHAHAHTHAHARAHAHAALYALHGRALEHMNQFIYLISTALVAKTIQ
jgi:hypothetical protein